MIRSRVVLPAPFGPMRPVNSPGLMVERDVPQDLPAAEPDPDPVQPEQFGGHRCSLETWSATALRRARTSASIQDW